MVVNLDHGLYAEPGQGYSDDLSQFDLMYSSIEGVAFFSELSR